MSKNLKGGGGKQPSSRSGSGLAAISDPEARRAAQQAALAQLQAGESSAGAEDIYVPETQTSAAAMIG